MGKTYSGKGLPEDLSQAESPRYSARARHLRRRFQILEHLVDLGVPPEIGPQARRAGSESNSAAFE